jgi:Ca-activated chloride channel family protein
MICARLGQHERPADEQAKAAIGRGLELLSEDDTFQLIDFSEHASQFGPSPLPATPYQLGRARRYLARLQGSGGTMMLNGIKAALNFPHDPDRLRFVCFLTDGYIGNEAEILREVQRRLGEARIFSFGVGTSPNRYLLNSMAKVGRGAVAYLAHDGDPVRTMDTFFESVSHPALTDLRIDWGGLEAREVFPRRIPDLFAGRPVLLTGRRRGASRKWSGEREGGSPADATRDSRRSRGSRRWEPGLSQRVGAHEDRGLGG